MGVKYAKLKLESNDLIWRDTFLRKQGKKEARGTGQLKR